MSEERTVRFRMSEGFCPGCQRERNQVFEMVCECGCGYAEEGCIKCLSREGLLVLLQYVMATSEPRAPAAVLN